MPDAGSRRTRATVAAVCSAAALAGLTGCLSVKRELAVEEQRRVDAWRERHAASRRHARLELTWDEAVAQLRSANDKVRATDLDCLRAEENLRQVRRALIPLLNVQAGYNRTLDGNADIDPFTFAASVFFDVPGMLGFKVRHEAAQLVLVRSRLGRELAWREQVIELHREFAINARLTTDLAQVTDAAARARAANAASLHHAFASRQAAVETALAESDERLGKLIGQPEDTFTCIASSLPAPGYETAAQRPAAATLARLPLRLAAVELVALRAREFGVNLQDWPELNIYVSNPAVYRRSGGEEAMWSTHDIFAGANVYWTLDTRGRRASQKRVLAAEAALRREALEREAAALAQKIETALARLAETDALLAALPATSGASALDTALTARRATLEAERREWQLVVWFFDDSRWTSQPNAKHHETSPRA